MFFNSFKLYFSHQINEIKKSKALIYLGFFLSLTHILTFFHYTYHYIPSEIYSLISSNTPENICWPFFENCDFLRFSSVFNAKISFLFYLFVSFLSVYFFLFKKIKYAYLSLIFLSFFRVFLVLMSFNITGNYHYMPLIISFLYLFFPDKKHSIPIMIVLFYMFSGLLKLNNTEWLTGASLYKIDHWNTYFILFLTYSVILLEIFIAPLILLKNSLKYISFFFLSLFHLISFYWVFYYYPLNCFSYLIFFPLLWFLDKSHPNFLKRLFYKKLPKSVYFALILFIFAQLMPRFYKGDSALTGKGRIWALNMYDASVFCNPYILLKYKDKNKEAVFQNLPLALRISCLPYVYYQHAQKLCQKHKDEEGFLDLDLHLIAKRKSDLKWTYLVRIENFCSKKIKYHIFKDNPWIKK